MAACTALLVFPGLWTLLWVRAQDMQYVLLPRKEHELIERRIPALPVLKAIDRTVPKGTPVFSFNDDRYYCQARFFAGWSERTGRAVLQAEDPEEAVEALRVVGVVGVLFSDEEQRSGRSMLFRSDVLSRYFQHVASANGWHFYTLAARE